MFDAENGLQEDNCYFYEKLYYMKFFEQAGKYFLLLVKVFARPEKKGIYYRQTIREIEKIGIDSFSIVVVISIFVGAVITIQTNYNLGEPPPSLLSRGGNG